MQLVAVACLGLLLAGCDQQQPTGAAGERLTVTQVSDGDTIAGVDQEGQRIRVRLLGIDTPEVAHGDSSAECGAIAARDSLRDLLLREEVTLVDDPRSDRVDRYGRRLAYVEVGGVDAGFHQVEGGWAEAWYPSGEPRPDRYDGYRQAERAAQKGHAGAWATCPHLGR